MAKYRVTLKAINEGNHQSTKCPVAMALHKTYPTCRVGSMTVILNGSLEKRIKVGRKLSAWITNYDKGPGKTDYYGKRINKKPVLPITIEVDLKTERVEIVD